MKAEYRENSDENYIIAIDQLKFKWPGSENWLIDIPSLTVRSGERVFIQGASGSGKSTFLNLICGARKPDAGSIVVAGYHFDTLGHRKKDEVRRDNIGLIFQTFNLVPYLSVRKNIELGAYFSKQKTLEIQHLKTSITEETSRLMAALDLDPNSYGDKAARNLSVGEQQRVAAARALIGRPKLVIADEPTSALDTLHRNQFLKLLLQECEHASSALIFVSHDPTLAPFFDRKIQLESGQFSE